MTVGTNNAHKIRAARENLRKQTTLLRMYQSAHNAGDYNTAEYAKSLLAHFAKENNTLYTELL
jgi:hypothetical protein